MNILIIGNGGREHALAWKIAQSPKVKQIWVAPGNAGTSLEKKVTNVAIAPTATHELVKFAQTHNITLTVIGPEVALAAGVSDAFQAAGLPCFGPSAKAAQLETSKAYCKDFLLKNNIPTAKFATFSDISSALAYAQHHPFPLVIKADGLAAGKGVFIVDCYAAAKDIIIELLEKKRLGHAGQKIVIEEFLQGEELSFIAMLDGSHCLALASSQDYKRRNNGNQGPNTGGMGAFSPSPLLTPALEQKIFNKVFYPTLNALKTENTPYVGFLYAGLMISNNEPKVLEFNCRLGDPETQVILMRMQSDLVDLCLAAIAGQLNPVSIEWDTRAALTVILTAEGYPENYRTGDIIHGLDQPESLTTKIFHAGTKLDDEQIVTHGGRVLAVSALGDNLQQAKDFAYQEVQKIHWLGCYYRTDIGA